MPDMALKPSPYFYLMIDMGLGCYFQLELLTISQHRATRKHLFLYSDKKISININQIYRQCPCPQLSLI